MSFWLLISFNSLIFKVLPFRPLEVLGRSSAPFVSGEAVSGEVVSGEGSDASLTGAAARFFVVFAIRKTELLDFGEVCCAEVSIAPAITQNLLGLEEAQAPKKYMVDLIHCQYFS